MAGIVEGAAVRERIVSVGDRKIVAVRGGAEVDHPPTVSADFQHQPADVPSATWNRCRSRRVPRDSSHLWSWSYQPDIAPQLL